MNYTMHDVWMLQYANFFVARYNYQIVSVQDANDDIWLANPTHLSYPVIRLTKLDIDNNYFDRKRVKYVHSQICKLFNKEGKCLELYMNVKDEAETDENSFMFTVHPDWKGNAELQSIFPGIDKVAHLVDEANVEMEALSRNLITNKQSEDARRKRLKEYQKSLVPTVTLTVAIICSVMFILSILLQSVSNDLTAISIFLGSYYKAFIVGMDEWWRLLTAGFVHIDFLHFFVNMIALFNLGRIIEPLFGKRNYTIILLGSIVMGSVFVFVGSGNNVTLGLSGGLYGLMGALLIHFITSGLWNNQRLRSQFLSTLMMNLIISFMPGISMLGHLGGFVGGICLAMIFTKSKQREMLRKNMIISFTILCITLTGLMYKNKDIEDVFWRTDLNVVELAENLGLDFYADHIYNSMLDFYEGR